MHAVIVLDGPSPSARTLSDWSGKADLVVATDGAVRLFPEGLSPHIVCGDFDTIDRDACLRLHPQIEFVHLPDQDRSDLEKALLLVIERGAEKVTLVSCMGGRVDHSLSALSTLIHYHQAIDIQIVGESSRLRVISAGGPRILIHTEADDIVSLISLSPSATVSIDGVAWPLSEAKIQAGTQGVSNRALGTEVALSIHQGLLAICHLHHSWHSAHY